MGTTDNAAANSAVKNLESKTTSSLSGSVGFGGDNNPDDVRKVSEALVANGRLDQPTSDATDAFNSKIITAQQDMADGLRPDGLINPDGPTETRFTNLVQGGMMKGPAVSTSENRPATGTRAGNAAVTAAMKQGDVKTARTQALQHAGDTTRTSFQQAQDVKRLNKAKVDAAAAQARAERADIKAREKAQNDQIMATQKARQQATNRSEVKSAQLKNTASKLARNIGQLLQDRASAAAKQNSNVIPDLIRDPSDKVEELGHGVRRDDNKGPASIMPIRDEVFAANRRSAQYLASRTDMQEFPRWEIEDINTQGALAIAKTADLIEQTHDLAPDQAKRLYNRVIIGINPDAQDMLDQMLGQTTTGGMLGVEKETGSNPLTMDEYDRIRRPLIEETTSAGQTHTKDQEIEDQITGGHGDDMLMGGSGTEWAFRKAAQQFKSSVDGLRDKIGDNTAPVSDVLRSAKINLTGTDQEVKGNLSELSKKYRAKGYSRAADNLDHFLNGKGKDRLITRDEARKDPFIEEAENENRERFVTQTFLGKTGDDKVNIPLRQLKDGESVTLTDYWDRERRGALTYLEAALGDLSERDRILADGRRKFRSDVTFTAARYGKKIYLEGTVNHNGTEQYDFEKGELGHLMGARRLSESKPPIAHEFQTVRVWGQAFEGTVDVSTGRLGNELFNPQITWRDTWKDVNPIPKKP